MKELYILFCIPIIPLLIVALSFLFPISSHERKEYKGLRHVIIVEYGNGINQKFVIHLRDKEIALRLGKLLGKTEKSYFNYDTFDYYVVEADKWYGRLMFQYDFHQCNNMEEVQKEIDSVDYNLEKWCGCNISLKSVLTQKELNVIAEQYGN